MMFMEHIDDGYIQVEVRCYVLYQLERYMIYLMEVCSVHRLALRWHLSKKTGEVLKIMSRGTNSVMNVLR